MAFVMKMKFEVELCLEWDYSSIKLQMPSKFAKVVLLDRGSFLKFLLEKEYIV